MYQDLNDNEFQELNNFYKSDVGGKYNKSIKSGKLNSYIESSYKYGELLMNYCINNYSSQDNKEI